MSTRIVSLLVLLAALLIRPASAQLSGTYTVDNSAPTAGTNYNTLQAAVAALVAQGVSGPVVFAINTGIASYAGFGIAGPITGVSATNTVTFIAAVGHTPVISGPAGANVQTIKLGTALTAGTGPSNIILSGLTITGAPNGAGIITAGCSNITIDSCHVYGTAGQIGSGIQLGTTTNSVVRNCEVHDVGMTAGTPGTNIYSGGISIYLSSSACTIARNRIHDCSGNGIHVGTSGPTTAVSNCIVINNFVWNCPGSSSYPGGISTRRTPGLVLSNNSVLMTSGVNGGIHMTATDGGNAAEVSNNVVRHLGVGGACFKFEATGTLAATVFDYNAYDAGPGAFIGAVAATTYSTLAAWQAVAAPNLAGKEVNTLAGSAGFVSGTNLHMLPASVGFNSGSAVASVVDDIDGEARTVPLCRGADETTGVGIFANFSATPTSGAAALSVSFTDQTFTSNPGGVQTWAWDFQNDGTNDSFVQNPTFNYVTPGVYSVKLTATDPMNGSSIFVRTNYITVGPYVFDAQTTPGTGNLTILGVPAVGTPGATSGYMFASFAVPGVLGTGPFFGLIPDQFTWQIISMPAAVGDLTHWILAPGFFPNVPLVLPAGSLSFLVGATVDLVQVSLTPAMTVASVSNPDRITF